MQAHADPAAAAWSLAGVSAALHVGKLPPAVPVLQAALGIGLVEAGFLLSLVQLAGMTLGLVVGLAADALGLRRSMLAGLVVILAQRASAAGRQRRRGRREAIGLLVACGRSKASAFCWR